MFWVPLRWDALSAYRWRMLRLTNTAERGTTARHLIILDGESDIWGQWIIDPRGKRGPLPVGAHPGNTGGKKGRSGRKPKKFKAMCRHVTNHPALLRRMSAILAQGTDKDVLSMVKTLADYVHTKPVQKHEVQTSSLEELVNAAQDALPTASEGSAAARTQPVTASKGVERRISAADGI